MPIAQMLLPEFDREMANTRKMLERVPNDKLDFKPHEKSMGLAQLAGHLTQMVGFANMIILKDGMDFTGDHKPFIPESQTNLLEVFDKSVADARPLIAGATDEDLGKMWTLKVNGKELFTMPRIAMLRSMVMNHIIHHRAQLGVYLRENDIPVPGMYGPSADEVQSSNAHSA
jgi:uncharacterized damage-inducible protein DinB